MSVSIPQVVTSTSASGAQVIDGSLKFFNGAYLTRTPGSAGNRKIWTYSCWVKFDENSSQSVPLLCAGDSSSDFTQVYTYKTTTSDIALTAKTSSSDKVEISSKNLLRDSGWYHVVAVFNSDAATYQTDTTIYVNGEEIERNTNTYAGGENYEGWVNSTSEPHYIGYLWNGNTFNGHMSQVYLIDGVALGAEYFGYNDPLTNTWRPKKFEAKGTTVNNGTVWSSGATNGSPYSGSYTWTTAFNGTPLNSYGATESGTSVNPYNIAFPDIPFSSLTLYTQHGGANGIWVNGLRVDCSGNATLGSGADSQTVGRITFTAEQLGFGILSQIGVNGQNRWFGLAVDGVLMVDSTTQNLDYGTNGCYLPFDGSAPIGHDQSGKGNHWTPEIFGGSMEISKATGALPILNTVDGGNIVSAGVRTDASHSGLVLALPLVGTDDDVSNWVNSGSTTKTITAVGDPTAPGGWAQSNFYSGSYYFDGTGDRLTTDIGSGGLPSDFCIEYWIYADSISGDRGHFQISGTAGGLVQSTTSLMVSWGQSEGDTNMYVGNANVTDIDDPNKNNVWKHYAVVRNSGTLKLYVNGIEAYSASNSVDMTSFRYLSISGYWNTNFLWKGYIQDFRIYTGIPKYTGEFIPASTNPDITPASPSGITYRSDLTEISDVMTTDGAVYFDGESGSYIDAGDSADYNLGTGDFTIEMWVRIPKNSRSVNNTLCATRGAGGTATGFNIGIFEDPSGRKLYMYSNGHRLTYATIVPYGWVHIAVTRESNALKSFINGVQEGTGTTTQDFSNTTLSIGSVNGGGAERTAGYISNFRLIKGTALYTATFNPPSEPLTNVTNTKLLCCQSNTLSGAAAVSPRVSGSINDGVVWSKQSTITPPASGFNSGGEIQFAFDGSTSTLTSGAGSRSQFFVINFAKSITVSSSLEVYMSSGASEFAVNGGSYGSAQNNGAWRDLSFTGTLTSLSVKGDDSQTYGNFAPRLSAIRIDGSTILTDPVTNVAGAVPTKNSPFMPDNINTVRGRETGYCTLSPLNGGTKLTLSDGNLIATGASGHACAGGTLYVSGGKWYWEAYMRTVSTTYSGVGMARDDYNIGSGLPGYDTDKSFIMYSSAGAIYYNSTSTTSYGTSWTTGDMIGCRYDDGYCYFYKNNVLMNASPVSAATLTSGYWTPVFQSYDDGVWEINFGQKPFKYVPPEGHQPLNLATVSNPEIIRPDNAVGVTTYLGNGATQFISQGNFSPDMVWMKGYDEVLQWRQVDTVRGQQQLNSNGTAAQTAWGAIGWLPEINGYNITDDGSEQNKTGFNYVSYGWKAGGDQKIPDLVFGVNTDDNGFDSSSTSRSYDTTGFSFGSYSIPQSHPGGTYGANSAQVYKSSSGKVVKWKVSTSTANKYIWTSSDGTNWVSTGSQYDTDGSIQQVTSKWIALSGGANAASVTVNGYYAFNVDDVGYASAAAAGLDAGTVDPNKASVGTKNGFSIIELTTPSSGTTYSFAHGLGAKPSFLIARQYETVGSFYVWHQSLSANNSYLLLNANNAVNTGSTVWASTDMTSTVISDTASGHWGTDQKMLYYAWTDIPGLQKFGLYEGNNNADGTFIELGFRPAIMIFKDIDATQNWIMIDDKRSPYNVSIERIFPNSTLEQYTNQTIGDFLSNGFKFRGNEAQFNAAETYVYAAWAHQPMKNLYGGHSNAR